MPTLNNSGNVMRWLEFPAHWQICAVTTTNIYVANHTELGNKGILLKVRRELGLKD